VFVVLWGGNQFTPLLTVYRDGQHFTDSIVYALLGAYVVGLIPALLYGSRLGAVIGERDVLWMSLACSAVASVVLALGPSSVVLTAVGRVVAGISVGLAMTAGTALVHSVYARAHPSDPRGAVVRSSMTVTAGLAAGAAASGLLGAFGPGPTMTPYAAHCAVVLVAAAVLAIGRPEARVGTPRGAGAVRALTPRLRTLWLLTASTAPWVFAAGSVSYALVPGLIRGVPASLLPAFAGTAALTTLTIGTLVQPWATRLVGRGAPADILGLVAITAGLALTIAVSATGDWMLGLAATIPLGAGFGLAIASGALRTEMVASRTGRTGLVGVFYALTYVGFAAPALIAVIAARLGYTEALALVTAAAAGTAVVAAVVERTAARGIGRYELPDA
jgi:hypothetical protein